MSLYEIESMVRSLPKLDKDKKPEPMTQAKMDKLKEKWQGMNLPDVRIN